MVDEVALAWRRHEAELARFEAVTRQLELENQKESTPVDEGVDDD